MNNNNNNTYAPGANAMHQLFGNTNNSSPASKQADILPQSIPIIKQITWEFQSDTKGNSDLDEETFRGTEQEFKEHFGNDWRSYWNNAIIINPNEDDQFLGWNYHSRYNPNTSNFSRRTHPMTDWQNSNNRPSAVVAADISRRRRQPRYHAAMKGQETNSTKTRNIIAEAALEEDRRGAQNRARRSRRRRRRRRRRQRSSRGGRKRRKRHIKSRKKNKDKKRKRKTRRRNRG